MTASLNHKKTVSLTEQAYLSLRDQVITCELAPGLDVSEKELAERLQMSKTPVREAWRAYAWKVCWKPFRVGAIGLVPLL